jgi:predicted alpha/beta superfamily hydrolase
MLFELSMADHVLYLLGPFDIPLVGPRRVRVYVPPRASHVPPPVLYMFDGQNVFHDEPSYAGGWRLHTTAHRLAKQGSASPVIVGIDHGGEARIHELAPWPEDRSGGRTDALVDWIGNVLKPRIQSEFGVASEPARVGIGGSSLGGLAALYAHFRRPEHFGLVLSMSPSIWVGRGRLLDFVSSQPKPWTSRIYLDAGAREANGSVLANAKRLADLLRQRGWADADLLWHASRQGTHSEKHWRRRAPAAIKFLFGGPAAVRVKRAA